MKIKTVRFIKKDTYKDEETADFAAEMWAEGASFFMYQSDSVDSLSSCCRLRNAVEDNVFSYTLGAGGIETGSKRVITLNINRITQMWAVAEAPCNLDEYVAEIVERVHKYLTAFNEKLWDDYNNGLLSVYKAGLISLDKQYLTIGINGFVEGAEYLGIPIDYKNEEYQTYAKEILETIKRLNAKNRTKRAKFYEVKIENILYRIPSDVHIKVSQNNVICEKSFEEIVKNIDNYVVDDEEIKKFMVW